MFSDLNFSDNFKSFGLAYRTARDYFALISDFKFVFGIMRGAGFFHGIALVILWVNFHSYNLNYRQICGFVGNYFPPDRICMFALTDIGHIL